jgi:hypothetical protein
MSKLGAFAKFNNKNLNYYELVSFLYPKLGKKRKRKKKEKRTHINK